MPDQGFTVSPAIYIDENGQEQLSYEHADIEDHSVRMAGIENHNHEQDNYFYEDPNAGIQNLFSETELDEDGLAPDEYVDEVIELPVDDLIALQDIAGGPEGYAAMTEFAALHLTPEIIQEYDDVMNSGDYEQIEEFVTTLYQWFVERGGLEYEAQGRDADVEEPNVGQQFVDNFLEEYGYDEYAGLMEWSQQNLSPEQIQHYDDIMATGSQQDVIDSVKASHQYALQNS